MSEKTPRTDPPVSFRFTPEDRDLLDRLVVHMTAKHGRRTQINVIRDGLRLLAAKEKLPKKSPE